tara:strand:- start:393 stop:884 length:492 start_codon:yes stop_codon:yes gene_type:complete
MPERESLEIVSDLMESLRKAYLMTAEFEGPIPERVSLPGEMHLDENSSWTEIVEALRMWRDGSWQASPAELKALTKFAQNIVSESSTLGQFLDGRIDEEEMVSQMAMPVSASLEQRKKTIFEVIIKQALSGEEWKDNLAGLMLANEISIEEVETELSRRRKKD